MYGSSPIVLEQIFPLTAVVNPRVTSADNWVFSESSGRLNIETAQGEFPTNLPCPRRHSVPYCAHWWCDWSVLQRTKKSWYGARNIDLFAMEGALWKLFTLIEFLPTVSVVPSWTTISLVCPIFPMQESSLVCRRPDPRGFGPASPAFNYLKFTFAQ